ncbi:hypothetical protein [Streptomyces tropicalis]|uniref:Uncharacterized protein n=1 Tax=Streptomyces tropicalis TaxID=3034234 RepID=A0ABT6A627_9ACTN|nr:hypothetical protein [Streptomyces tropicalis]MDF3300103.1 hypothetical protein [Streptomyces tropicalis]
MIEETLRAVGWWPGRRIPIDRWRETLEKTGLIRTHAGLSPTARPGGPRDC